MGEVKLHLEADSLKDLFEDLTGSLEEMGAIVVKVGDIDIPEQLETILKAQGIMLFKSGNGVPSELLEALIEEEQEEVIDTLMNKKEPFERILEILDEKGYNVKKASEEGDNY